MISEERIAVVYLVYTIGCWIALWVLVASLVFWMVRYAQRNNPAVQPTKSAKRIVLASGVLMGAVSFLLLEFPFPRAAWAPGYSRLTFMTIRAGAKDNDVLEKTWPSVDHVERAGYGASRRPTTPLA